MVVLPPSPWPCLGDIRLNSHSPLNRRCYYPLRQRFRWQKYGRGVHARAGESLSYTPL